MRYRTTAGFDRDLTLPPEHRAMFLATPREQFLPAIAAGAFSGATGWPTRLRIHRLTDSGVFSLSWNFSSPDGRATFHLDRTSDGDPILVWRRIGDHSVYRQP